MAEDTSKENKVVEVEVPVPVSEKKECDHKCCCCSDRKDPISLREQELLDAAIKDHRDSSVYVNDTRYTFLRFMAALDTKLLGADLKKPE